MSAWLRRFVLASALMTVCASAAAETPPEKQPRPDRFGDALSEGAIYRVGPSRFRAGGFVYFLAFSKDGKTLLSVNSPSSPAANVIHRWEADSTTAGVVRHWEAASGKQLRQFPLPDKIGYSHGLALSPDKSLLAVLPNTWTARPIALLDLTTGRVVSSFANGEHGGGIAFSPDGRTLATGDMNETILFWNPATGASLGKLEGCKSACCVLAFSPDGKLLCSAHQDKTVRLWDWTTRKEVHRFPPIQSNWPVGGVTFSPDGKLVAAHRSGSVDVWNTNTGKQVRSLPLPGITFSPVLAFSPDGKLLAARDLYDLCLWEPATGKLIRRRGRFGYLTSLAFSPDGKVLATGDDNVQLWQVATGEEIRPGGQPSAEITSAAFSPDGKRLATGGPDEFIRLWDTDTGTYVRRFKACPDGNVSVSFSPDGKSLFSRHGDLSRHGNEFFQWDAATGKELRRFQAPHPGFFAALSPSGRNLAWLGTDVALHVRDIASGKESQPWQWENAQFIRTLHFSPREDLLVLNGLAGIRSEILDLRTRKFYPPFEREWDLAGFSPDGRVVARTDKEGRIHFQETETAMDLACTSLADVLPFAGGGPRRLAASAFSPDGKTLAVVMASEPIRLWETATGKERERFAGHIGYLKQLAFSPDGGKLFSVSSEKTGLVWQVFGPEPGQRPTELSARQLRALWTDLASDDGRTAFRALRALTAAEPTSVVDLLRREGHPEPRLDRQQLARWIDDLDADEFAAREKATAELTKLGAVAEGPLRRALQDRPSLEARRRLETLLEKLKGLPIPSTTVRGWRAVEVLEHLATPEARRLLEEWAEGEPEARLTREAKASLERLARHPRAEP
jgi:WD40 repeat protein